MLFMWAFGNISVSALFLQYFTRSEAFMFVASNDETCDSIIFDQCSNILCKSDGWPAASQSDEATSTVFAL